MVPRIGLDMHMGIRMLLLTKASYSTELIILLY
jgi:hypothetical protein